MLDLSNALDHPRADVEDFRISDWDKHPNALGHRVIFETLRDAILKHAGRFPDFHCCIRDKAEISAWR